MPVGEPGHADRLNSKTNGASGNSEIELNHYAVESLKSRSDGWKLASYEVAGGDQ
jgi:hypothetical protein